LKESTDTVALSFNDVMRSGNKKTTKNVHEWLHELLPPPP